MLSLCLRAFLGTALTISLAMAAEKIEKITLADGRIFTGIYDDETQAITLTGPMTATIKIDKATIVKREAAGTTGAPRRSSTPTATTGPTSTSTTTTTTTPLSIGSADDDTAWAAMVAEGIPWAKGDRILFIGDALIQNGQAEIPLRLQNICNSNQPTSQISVFGVQNHAIPLEKWVAVGRTEINRRPPQVVIICTGVGDVVAAMPKEAPAANTTPAPLTLPTPEAWGEQLTTLVTAAKQAGAAVVVCTPAIVGDKPEGGPGAAMLQAYAQTARTVATTQGVTFCDLRTPLLERLRERNPKSTRDSGILSREPGQLRPDGIAICAAALAPAIAQAVQATPWSARISGATFATTTSMDATIIRGPRAAVTIHYTTDGSEPTTNSPVLSAPIPVTDTTFLRILARSQDPLRQQRADAWFLKYTSSPAQRAENDLLPGLWAMHIPQADWSTPRPTYDAATINWLSYRPQPQANALTTTAVDTRPETVGTLHFSGRCIIPVDGQYLFEATGSGATRLIIDSQLVIDRTDASATRRGAIELKQGQHLFEVFHRGASVGNSDNAKALRIRIAEYGQRLRPLPDLLLFRSATAPAAIAVSEPNNAQPTPTATATATPEVASSWRIHLPGGPFDDSTKITPETTDIAAGTVKFYYTTDGTEPTLTSPAMNKVISLGSTTHLRVLGVAPDGTTSTAEAWYTENKRHDADTPADISKPGLWMEYCRIDRWTDPISGIDKKRSEFTSAWPNVELESFTRVPIHYWPNVNFGLRFSGYFFAPVDGTYVFSVNSDDASRITMGIVPILRNEDLHADRRQVESALLTAGWHQIEIPYGQGPGVISLSVSVGITGQRLQPLPDLFLRRSAQAPSNTGITYDPLPEDP